MSRADLTEHERGEFRRCAEALAGHGANEEAAELRALAAVGSGDAPRLVVALEVYRAWLVFGRVAGFAGVCRCGQSMPICWGEVQS